MSREMTSLGLINARQELIDSLESRKFATSASYKGATINEFLSSEAVIQIKKWLTQENLSLEEVEGRISKIEDHLKKSAEHYKEFLTVENSRREILKKELESARNPEVDVRQIARAKLNEIGYKGQLVNKGQKKAWNEFYDSSFLSSAYGGSNKDRRAIREGRYSLNAGKPGKLVRNLVFDAREDCLSDMRESEAELTAFIEGRNLSKKERQKIRQAPTFFGADATNSHRKISNISEFAATGLFKLVDKVGRGIITEGVANEHSSFVKYDKKRDELFSNYAHLIDSNSAQSVSSLMMLKHLYKAHCDKMAQQGISLEGLSSNFDAIIDEKIKRIEGVNEEALKEFNQKIDDLNKKALEDAEELTKKSDDMAKFRILQVLLLASPFGLFNFLGPLASIIGPLFNSDLTLGESMAEIITNEYFWIFGDLADAIEIDWLVEKSFDNIPVVQQIGESLKEGVSTGLVQNTGGLVAPAFNGSDPLMPLAIAVIFSIRRFGGPELDYFEQKNAKQKENEKALEKAFNNFCAGSSVYDKDGADKAKYTGDAKTKAEAVIRESFTLLLDEKAAATNIAELINFIAEDVRLNGDKNLSIFDGFKIKCVVEGASGEEEKTLNLKELFSQTDLTSKKAVSNFIGNLSKENKEEMVKRMLVFQSEDISENKDAFFNLTPEDLKAKGSELLKDHKQDHVITMCRAEGFKTALPNNAPKIDLVKDFTKQFVAQEIERWKLMRKTLTPNTSVEQPELATPKGMVPKFNLKETTV